MGLWHGWIDRVRSLVRRDEEERALREEIRFHIERETAKLMEEGLAPREARREAYRRFGGVERTRERTRDERGTRPVEEAFRDLRFAFRSFVRAPGPTITVLLTVALGIGGATAMFGVVDGVLLRPLPFGDPDALVAVWEVSEGGVEQAASYWNFDDWRRDVAGLEALAAFTGTRGATVMTSAGGARAGLTGVSADFFEVVGLPPLLGRLPGPDENRAGGPPVAVVGERFWREELGAPAALEGVTLGAEDEVWDVVGVLPGKVDLPAGADVWLPLDRRVPWSVRGNHVVRVVGRLGPGVPPARAREELEASHARIRAAHPEVESVSVRIRSLERELLGDARRPLVLLLGAAGFLLLVACANVASTLLARGMARRRELAVRASLGAGRGRLVRQLLAESLVLSALGGTLALPLAWGVLALTSSLDPGAVPRLGGVGLDGRALLFAGGATLATAALFGLLPAVQLTRDLGGRLRSGRGAGADRRARATWRVLMGGEVALALVLVTGAGLTLRSLSEILGRDLGFSPRGVVTGELHVPPEKYASAAEAVEWLDRLVETLAADPGVGAAGLNVLLPVRGRGALGSPVLLEGGERSEAVFQYRVADGGWFRALDIPLIRGRLFDDEDADGPHVALVDEVMARTLWPGEDPLGKRFNAGGMDPYPEEWLTVVGVVGEVRTWSQDEGTNPTFYVSHRQRPAFLGLLGTAVVVRTDDPARGVAVLRETVRRMDPDVPVRSATLGSLLADSAADRRFTGFVLGAFAAVSLLLAAVGVYGVVSYTVARRTREMGIRLAVGASPARLLGRVQTEALGVVGMGLVVGLLASSALGATLESVLFEVSPLDPWTRLGAAAVLLGTAAVASWLPASRSTRVDPVAVLRGE